MTHLQQPPNPSDFTSYFFLLSLLKLHRLRASLLLILQAAFLHGAFPPAVALYQNVFPMYPHAWRPSSMVQLLHPHIPYPSYLLYFFLHRIYLLWFSIIYILLMYCPDPQLENKGRKFLSILFSVATSTWPSTINNGSWRWYNWILVGN